MTTKTAPLGICDHCGAELAEPYTSKGKPRLYCSVQCRNTGNSRAGAEARGQKARERVARGTWQNPRDINPPNPDRIAAGVRRARRAEVEAGTWQNPGLTPEAREKNSQPRKHGDNPALVSALRKLKAGVSVAELSPEEAEAHRDYRRELEGARRDEINEDARRRYQEQQQAMTAEQREGQREKWRAANRRRKRGE